MHFQSHWHVLTILALLSTNTIMADGVDKVIPHTVPSPCMQLYLKKKINSYFVRPITRNNTFRRNKHS